MNILKSTIAQLREQRMLSAISITGTALSIFLIMVVVISQEVKVVPFAPVSGRDRMLHARYGTIIVKDNEHYQSNGSMSIRSARRIYGDLPGTEAVSIYSAWVGDAIAKVPGIDPVGVALRRVDDQYWKVFDHTFISGKPFTKEDVEAARHVAVIDATTALRLFGTTDAAGREFQLDYNPTTVAGVVRDVSTLADAAFAQVWEPHVEAKEYTWNYGLMGGSSVTILANSKDDFDNIRKAADHNMEAYNKEVEETSWSFVSRGRPYTQEQDAEVEAANVEPDMDSAHRRQLIIFAILLLVPAINLSSLTESRLRSRVEELGVRRAFGCTRSRLLGQLFGESMIITVLGGIIGLILSVAYAFIFSNFLFAQGFGPKPLINLGMLLRPATFGFALLFCFILNLLSTGVPAWKATRTNIVNAINKH